MALLYPSVEWDPALLAEPQLMGEASPASMTDFRLLQAPRPLNDSDVVEFIARSAATLSVYTIDLQELRLVLVQLPSTVDLRSAPFMYQTQRRHATAMLTLTFPVATRILQQLEQLSAHPSSSQPGASSSSAPQPGSITHHPSSTHPESLCQHTPDQTPCSTSGLLSQAHIVHIHSTGRCGSTLLQKALGQHPAVQSLSEPDAFWCITTLAAQLQHPPDTSADGCGGERPSRGATSADEALARGGSSPQQDVPEGTRFHSGLSSEKPDSCQGTHLSRAMFLEMARTLTLLQVWLCLAQQPSRTTVIFKHRSNVVFAARLLAEAVPSSRAVWMCRALPGFAESWCSLVAGGRWWMHKLMRWTPLGTAAARRLSALSLMSDGSMGGMAQRLRESVRYGGRRDVMWLWSLVWICQCEEALNLQLSHPPPMVKSSSSSSTGGASLAREGSIPGASQPLEHGCTGQANCKPGHDQRMDCANRPEGGFFAAVISYERLLAERGDAARRVLLDLGLHLPPQGSEEAQEMEQEMAKVFASNSQAGTVMSSRRAKAGLSSIQAQASWLGPGDLRELQRLVDFDAAMRGCDFALGLKETAGAGPSPGGVAPGNSVSDAQGGGNEQGTSAADGLGACTQKSSGMGTQEDQIGTEACAAAGMGGVCGRAGGSGGTSLLNGSFVGSGRRAVIRSIWHRLDADEAGLPAACRYETGGLRAAGRLAAVGVMAGVAVGAGLVLARRYH